MTDHHAIFIDGRWRAGGGAPLESTDPVRGDVLWAAAGASADDVDAACAAARRAFGPWYRAGLDARVECLRRFASVLADRREPLAELLARETGKVLWDCRGELVAAVNKIDISIDSYHVRTGLSVTEEASTRREIRHKPHGVLAVFGPFNFPLHLPNGHIVPALLAGNTVVFKPSETTPAVASAYLECWREADLPDGVLNVVIGGRETGAALAGNDGVDGILFTGSAATGESIHRRFAGRTGKILALELGGNNPLVLADCSDVDGAVLTIIQSAFISAGQRCTCARRLVAVDSPANREVLARLVEVMPKIRIGDPLADPQPFIGSLVSAAAAGAVLAAGQRLIDMGGSAVVPMERPDAEGPFVTPGLIDVTAIADPPDEEIFGPLLQIARVRDLDEAVAAANRTRFGLAASMITDDDDAWQRFLVESRAGVVNRNLPSTGASSAMPFGGIGASGNLRPSAWYAADYCAWPVASMSRDRAAAPDSLPPGITL